MDTAAQVASAKISGLAAPPAAPPPSAGGAGSVGMGGPVSASLTSLLLGGADPRGVAGRRGSGSSGAPGPVPPSMGPATPLAPSTPDFPALATDKVLDKLTKSSEWIKGLNILPNKDVQPWASYLMPGLSFGATGLGLATNYDKFRSALPLLPPRPPGRSGGATAVNRQRLRLDAFITKNGNRLSRAANRLGDSVDAMGWAASQPLMRMWMGAGTGGIPSASQLMDEPRPLVNRTGPALASKVTAGRAALEAVIADLARKPSNPAWGKVGRAAGPVGAAFSAATGAMEQWQKDAGNPSLTDGDKKARAGVRGALVAAGGWAGGALGGAAAGAAAGSVVPVVGTAIGGVVGGVAGGIGGSIVGDGIADAVMQKWDEWRP